MIESRERTYRLRLADKTAWTPSSSSARPPTPSPTAAQPPALAPARRRTGDRRATPRGPLCRLVGAAARAVRTNPRAGAQRARRELRGRRRPARGHPRGPGAALGRPARRARPPPADGLLRPHGRTSHALRQYLECRRALVGETGWSRPARRRACRRASSPATPSDPGASTLASAIVFGSSRRGQHHRARVERVRRTRGKARTSDPAPSAAVAAPRPMLRARQGFVEDPLLRSRPCTDRRPGGQQ